MTVLQNLNNDLRDVDNIATGDIEHVVKLLETAADIQTNKQSELESGDFVAISVETVNNLGWSNQFQFSIQHKFWFYFLPTSQLFSNQPCLQCN